jgi:hypothetical protein
MSLVHFSRRLKTNSQPNTIKKYNSIPSHLITLNQTHPRSPCSPFSLSKPRWVALRVATYRNRVATAYPCYPRRRRRIHAVPRAPYLPNPSVAAFNATAQRLTTWRPSDPNPCRWEGISCSLPDLRVQSMC